MEFVGVVWPGPAVLAGLRAPRRESRWRRLYKEFVKDGVSGFWNDIE